MTEETMKKANNHGGAREGAGRKKSLPDGAKPSTFILTEYEKAAVKDYIVSMHREAAGKPKISINMEETLFKLAFQMLKPSAAKDVNAKVSSFAARGRFIYRCLDLDYTRSKRHTFSMWLVIGNMSTGCTTMVL